MNTIEHNLIPEPGDSNTLVFYEHSVSATILGLFIISIITLLIVFVLEPGIGVPSPEDTEGYATYLLMQDKFELYQKIVKSLWVFAVGTILFRFTRKHWSNHRQYLLKSVSVFSFSFIILTFLLTWLIISF